MRCTRCATLMVFIALVILALGFFGSADAQTVVAIDIQRATLLWDWTQGTGGAATEFRAKCGQVSGTYTKVTILANPAARSMPVKDAILGSGNWFCAVSAANRYGESGLSNEVPFDAGDIPSNPSNVRVGAP